MTKWPPEHGAKRVLASSLLPVLVEVASSALPLLVLSKE